MVELFSILNFFLPRYTMAFHSHSLPSAMRKLMRCPTFMPSAEKERARISMLIMSKAQYLLEWLFSLGGLLLRW